MYYDFFSFNEYWQLYIGFTLFVLLMLLLDLGVFHKKIHIVSIKEASLWTTCWISLALFFRAFFIALGSVLMEYKFIVVFFGLLLMFTGLKMVVKDSSKDDLEKNIFIRLLNKIFKVHPKTDDQSFFITIRGERDVTPLFLALVFIEVSDIIFAIDSVPAIFSITKEPLIVFTSNIFAIMGLRSMYFMLTGALDKFYYIKYGLAGVLVFVGLKMVYLNEHFGGKFPISWSLGIIFTMIAASIIYSLLMSNDKKIATHQQS